MSQVLKLLRLQIDNKYDFFKSNKRKTFKSFGGYAVIAVLLYIGVFYLARQIISYLTLNINREFLTILFASLQGVALIFGIASVLNHLYMSKDNELLIVFPVTFNQLYLSKILILYISELIFNLVYITPIFLAIGTIGLNAGSISWVYFLSVFIMIPILPIIPLAVAVIISIPSMYVIKFFRKRQLLASIVIISLVVVGFYLYMKIVPTITGAFNIADKQLENGFKIKAAIKRIGSNIPLYFWLSNGLFTVGNLYYDAIWLLGSLVLFVICTILIKPFFRSIVLSYNEATQIKGRKKEFKTRSVFSELLITQFRLLLRSPSYVFEYLLFPILMPIFTIAYDKLLFPIAVNEMGKALIVASHLLVVAIIAFISNAVSSTAISRDGGMVYFVKSSPVSFYKQTFVKILFNIIINFSAILLTTILCLIVKIADPTVIILTGLVVFIFSIGHICQSFDWDLRNPLLKWYDSSEVTTLSKNTTKCVVLGIGISFILFAIMAVMYHNLVVGFFINLFIGIIYSLSRIYLLYYRIEYYYNEMEI